MPGADAGPRLAAEHEPVEALTRWLLRFTEFVATKRGLAAALHSGDPAFDALPGYFTGTLGPALEALLATASARDEIDPGLDAEELLLSVGRLCLPGPSGDDVELAHRVVELLVQGMRFRAITTR
ncbi:hypothetical protein WIS52_01760 [Pseudonocardia nematodicida]|uniref:Transcriptional regulator SbtR-like C-terminal domain-containing protein n=1 Tax=Pseudonocardia nematodicida TaxID=1206997 RepID=A0ABV1K3Z6_9PSEU